MTKEFKFYQDKHDTFVEEDGQKFRIEQTCATRDFYRVPADSPKFTYLLEYDVLSDKPVITKTFDDESKAIDEFKSNRFLSNTWRKTLFKIPIHFRQGYHIKCYGQNTNICIWGGKPQPIDGEYIIDLGNIGPTLNNKSVAS
jgi:hypothetical protein